MNPSTFLILLFAVALSTLGFAQNSEELESLNRLISIGGATVSITPTEPIRMSGYGGRNTLSEGATGQLYAKALAFGEGDEACLLVTADLVGIPAWLKKAVAERLGLPLERLAICATHTHSGPQLRGLLEPIFMEEIPSEEMAVIGRYSDGLVDKLVAVCQTALGDRRASRLDWGIGEVGFASNRRVLEEGKWTGFGVQVDGPVDHSLPVMRVVGEKGELRAVFANYACHCTTLGGDMHSIHGDWAGEAQRLLEERHPGAMALIAIGCGADANPNPRGNMDAVLQNGKALADEVDRVIGAPLTALRSLPVSRIERIELPLDPLPSREYWEEHAVSTDKTAYYGQLILDRLGRGVSLPTSIDYPVQTWTFGTDLAMVFLPGEVVVDYSIKLKEMFDSDRIWINAYANAAPSYIPSRRLYDEGGYEVDRSMLYYDKPTRLSPDTEELVLDAVLKQVPHPFFSERTLQRIPAPIEAEAALETLRIHEDLQVELVASEPLVMDPIDIAWGADGRLWVVEMADYPLGLDGAGQAGGRIRVLEDENGDGIYDRSTLFMDGVGFPTSVLPWRDGVLVTAAPDILFARDTDGDGRADDIERLYTGFNLGNQQHLVNGLQWGMDGWVYLANGDSGGIVRSVGSENRIDINGRDLRIKPEERLIEAISGRSQYGRNRDGWGNWFGNSNSWPGWHYALDDTYLQRNPHVLYANGRSFLPSEPQAGPVYPISRTLSRYNDYEKANRFTSASGFMLYEDDALGEAFVGNSFVAESVHNLVSRAVVYPEETTFKSRRAPEEFRSEFLASTDNWFRPTAIRSGPDGALYVVDMYRLVIEHPTWVSEDWQRKLDLRDGHDKGRIYRISGNEFDSESTERIDKLDTIFIVEALDSSNRWRRDQAHQMLVWKQSKEAIEPLRRIVVDGRNAQGRGQALRILEQLGGLDNATLLAALSDAVGGVRRQAVLLAESRLNEAPRVGQRVWELAADADAQTRMQVAYALGESRDTESGEVLALMAIAHHKDPLMLSAILSSAVPHQKAIADAFLPHCLDPTYSGLFEGLTQTALGTGNQSVLELILGAIVESSNQDRRLEVFSNWLNIARRSGFSLKQLQASAEPSFSEVLNATDEFFRIARARVLDRDLATPVRKVAIDVLRSDVNQNTESIENLTAMLNSSEPVDIQVAVFDCLVALSGTENVSGLFENWKSHGPYLRNHIVGTFLNRRESTLRLLQGVEQHPAMASTFSPAQIAGLRRNADNRIQKLANSVFGHLEHSDRSRLVDEFESSLELVGDLEAGRVQFSALCTACHKVGDVGFEVGPALASLTDKSPESMLVAILDPNRAVEDKYLQFVASTRDGRSFAGILDEETATSLTLVNAGGLKQEILRKELVSLESGDVSLMPEGFESEIDAQDLADLIAFIGASDIGLRVHPDLDGSVGLTASRGMGEGVSVRFNAESGAFEWMAETDSIEWAVYGLKAGYYDIFSDASLAAEYEGRPFTLSLDDHFVTGVVSTTGGFDRFRKRKFGNIRVESDLEVAKFELRHSLKNGLLSLRELRLIPVDASK